MNLVPLFCICLILQNNYLLCLALNRKRRYNNGKENVHQSNKVVEAMGKETVYCIMHTERCVAQVSTAGECKIYFEDFMPYGLVLKESNDFDWQLFSLKLLCLRCGQNFIIDQLIGLIKCFDHLGRFRMEIDFI